MPEVLKTQYVNQRQYGIIAPDKDSNQVKRLVTSGMYPCFGVALFDQESNVGMFTHLDYEDDLMSIFTATNPLLEALGATKLAVETVNIDSPHLPSNRRHQIVDHRNKGLDGLIDALIQKNVFSGRPLMHHGVSKEAIFEPRIGIIPATFEQLGLRREQIDLAMEYLNRLAEIENRNFGNSRALAVSCAYMPPGLEVITFTNIPKSIALPDTFIPTSKKPILSQDQINSMLANLKFPPGKHPK